MPEETIQKQIERRLAELPEDVRRAVQSTDLGSKIQDITKKHSLHIDQAATLQEETLLVMLGFSDPLELANHIGERVRVKPEEANALAEEITRQIFMPIRESMKKFMEERAQQIEAEEAAAAVTSSVKQGPMPATPLPAASVAPTTPPKPSMPPAPAPKPPTLSAADVALTTKTVSASKPEAPPASAGAPKPPPYKADPYREPPE